VILCKSPDFVCVSLCKYIHTYTDIIIEDCAGGIKTSSAHLGTYTNTLVNHRSQNNKILKGSRT
jgi:hypothetical protein